MMVDSVSAHLLCASRRAVQNLKEEKATGRIIYTGDIMYDLYKKRIGRILKSSDITTRLLLKPKDYIYCTIHRAINTGSKARMLSFLKVFKNTEKTVILPIHPRTEKNLRQFGLWTKFKAAGNLRIISPVGYGDSLVLNRSSACVMTDSGGVVREAFFNSVPSIMIDDTSEWLDLFLSGWSKLTGADETLILKTLEGLKKPGRKPNLFGDGFAANRTVKYLLEC
jgi:UDP-N-acetylglucosamine 2-epimerase